MNASDYGELEITKNIGRGFFYKLISTYNNGNLYGVAAPCCCCRCYDAA